MELYYKLLDLIEGKYTTHETVEEVRHYITHRVSDMQYDYKVTDKLIRTPFPNYDFHYVIVEDDNEFREFVYFYDTIEEELDSREDDEMREQRDRAINLLNEKTTVLFNANRTIDFLRKRIFELETDDSERSEIEYLKEVIMSKESRIDVLEAGIKESERNEEYWKSRCKNLEEMLEEMLEKIRDVVSEFCYPF